MCIFQLKKITAGSLKIILSKTETEMNVLRVRAIQIIHETLGERGLLAKVSPNIKMGGGGVGKNITCQIFVGNFTCKG
jgi:hypothetical protein